MPIPSPIQLVQSLVEAMNRCDIDAALSHYEPDAVLVAQPGMAVVGHAAIRQALTQMLAGQPTLTTHAVDIIPAGNLALYHAAWSMTVTAPDGSPVTVGAKSADVLRQQPGGEWKIAVDNPWGTEGIPG
jgi:uncharacterized protein (TIGR02246 family)